MTRIAVGAAAALALGLFVLVPAAGAQERPAAKPGDSPAPAPAAADCPPPVEKVCVAVPGTRKTTRAVYKCKTVDYCIPALPGLCRLLHGCSAGCPGCCAGPLCKHVLLKRIVTEECPTTTCEVQAVPVCQPAPPCAPAPARQPAAETHLVLPRP
jgi:hypothetical protein